MKILIRTLRERLERYSDLAALPADWELIFAEDERDTAKLLQLGGDADVLITDPMKPNRADLINAMPNLKLINSEGVGFNQIDLEAARARGVYVCNSAGVNKQAVAEQAVLLMLMVLRRAVEGDAMVRAARQQEAKDTWSQQGIRELGDCTVGILGLGAIGEETAKRLLAFGCRVCYWDAFPRTPEQEKALGVERMELSELLAVSDILSLHMAVNQDTVNFMNAQRFAQCKDGVILINTARGDLVDQQALVDALKSGKVALAGLDCLFPEPVRPDNPLLHLPDELAHKVTFSPHLGGVTQQAFRRANAGLWENVRALEAGQRPAHIVNGL